MPPSSSTLEGAIKDYDSEESLFPSLLQGLTTRGQCSGYLDLESIRVLTRFGPNRVAADMGEMEDLIFW